MFKKMAVILLTIVFMLSSASTSFASSSGISDYDKNLQSLLTNGLTQDEAVQVLSLDRITKQMDGFGQKLDIVDGKATVINPDNLKNGISKEDEKYITKVIDKLAKQNKKIGKEKKSEDLQSLIKSNPARHKYRVTYDDGTWIEVSEKSNAPDIIKSDKVTLSGYTEVEVASDWTPTPPVSNQELSYQLSEYTGIYYTNCSVWQKFKVTGTASSPIVTITDYNGGQYCYGTFISLNNTTGGVCKYDHTPFNNDATIWTNVSNQVVWSINAGASTNFTGVFNLSFSGTRTWTQYAKIMVSIAKWHKYAGSFS